MPAAERRCPRSRNRIADALEAAHKSGIVHRDLKPANSKVRPDVPRRSWSRHSNEGSSCISADGRFMAYVSDESGRDDVYAIPASGQGRCSGRRW